MAKYDLRTFIPAYECLSVDELPDGTFDAINVAGRAGPIRISPPMRIESAPAPGEMVIEFSKSVAWVDAASFHAAFEPAE